MTTDPWIDRDPEETREWLDSLHAVLEAEGTERARFLIGRLMEDAQRRRALGNIPVQTDYVNTIHHSAEPPYPGDLEMERRIEHILRWNAAVMVARANRSFAGLGGHISTYASAATLFEVGFNHFFRGPEAQGGGDQVFFQGHASPGIYARSFLEGRIDAARLDRFRREAERGRGLSSYPHPRLMPDYWQFPTVSMGLGPITAIYQARFNRYLHSRGIKDTSPCRVWAFVGDGETDEPESLGALSIAAREGLDNLTFVVNANLQRLDGPVRGNGKIIQELESVFRGNGWNVIKVVWGSEWDPILDRDVEHHLHLALNRVVDGEWQKYASEPGSYTREHFFGQSPEIRELVAHVSDEEILRLRRGGHDPVKVHAAYRAAVDHPGQPTVILAHTVKGWTLGEGFEAKNVTHQIKKLSLDQLREFRDRLELPIPDKDLEEAPYYHPGERSPEVEYLLERRRALGGSLPARRTAAVAVPLLPGPDLYTEFRQGVQTEGGVSTTMAFVRLLTKLLKQPELGRRIVPIVPDEARTFGMDPLFRMIGIYAAHGQLYEPIDRNLLLYYREAKDGQLLEEGITEAGSVASFTAAGTCYATHGEPMIPFYVFYSMFGFQRTGDQIWACNDMRARGFLLGATAGRTTLNGEGLQHEDGHSHILAATVPSVRAYDPAFAYEVALIVDDGLRRMLEAQEDVVYYITLQNENYPMPAMPEGVQEGVLRGIYRFAQALRPRPEAVQLFASGCIVNEALRAQRLLDEEFQVAAQVWNVTSYQMLRREALAAERWNRLHPDAPPRRSYLETVLEGTHGPFIASSDWMKLVPDQVARWIPGRFVVLGTDGFGMSDTREALRRHFEVDAESIAAAALSALAAEGRIPPERAREGMRRLGLDPDHPDPLGL